MQAPTNPIKQLANLILILWFEPFFLIACIYTFWFPSGFMADTLFHPVLDDLDTIFDPASNINWVVIIMPPFLILWGVWTLWTRRDTVRFAVQGVGVLVVLVGDICFAD